MADMVVSIVKDHVLPRAQEELKLIANADEKIEELVRRFNDIQEMLKSLERRQDEEDEEPVNRWLAELKCVSYDVDDVIDQWRTEIPRPNNVNCFSFIIQSIVHNSCTDGLYSFIQNSFLHQFLVRFAVGHRIDSLEKRLDQVLKKYPDLKQSRSEEAYQGRRESSSSQNNYDSQVFRLKEDDKKDPKEFFAREGDKKHIITKLEDRKEKSIISITGIDGMGKTTLARHVFDDPKVKTHFETLIWVKVPKPFNRAKLPQCTTIEQTPMETKTFSELEGLTQHVNGKLVLVVLDDAREDYDDNSWSALVTEFKKAANGSKFLVTSPRNEVAHQMKSNLGCCKVYDRVLKELPFEDSWSLFNDILRNMDAEVEDMGKEIVRRCDGFPLAIDAVGRLLITKKSRHDWTIVLHNNAWEAEAVKKKVYPALRIYYSELPRHLKSCFAYCAIFNEGETIDTDDLVNLWMAQGLVPYSPDSPELEAKGDGYVSKLKGHSFFEVVEEDKYGKTISFSIHNTIHKFALDITNQEFAVKKIHRAEDFIIKTYSNCYHLLRHLTLLCPHDEAKVFPSSVYEAEGLRTLRVQPVGSKSKLGTAPPADIFSRLTRLRALDLSKSDIEEFPGQVEQLIHLRYLNLSETNLERLPEEVCNLYNLQTLSLKKCEKLVELPQGVGKMKNLRHLEISETRALKRLPQRIGRLTSLRTLSRFIVGGECKIGELKKLNSLRGRLEIEGIEKVANPDEAKEAEMHMKEHLDELKLVFPEDGRKNDKRLKGIIKGLTLHPNLKELVISNYPGTNFPNFWMTQTKLKMEVLRLNDFKNCAQLSPGGKIKQLTELHMEGMYELKNVDLGFFKAMPQLVSLNLRDCPKLKKLLCHLHDRELKELYIQDCPQLEWPPLVLPKLVKLSLTGNTGVLKESQIKLPKLKHLRINCSPHSSLPQGLRQLQELQTLEIMNCLEIDSLPDELRNLPKLQELRVNSCPKLTSCCQKEDWDKISGIPDIIIDYKKIDRTRNLREKGAVKKKAVEVVRTYSRALIDGFEEIFW